MIIPIGLKNTALYMQCNAASYTRVWFPDGLVTQESFRLIPDQRKGLIASINNHFIDNYRL